MNSKRRATARFLLALGLLLTSLAVDASPGYARTPPPAPIPLPIDP